MRLEHLKAFAVLAEELNFRRAAARLFVSQPTLTAQIHGLEKDLGVRLFERDRVGTRLTRDGLALLPRARETLRSVDDLESVAAHGDDATPDRLRLGMALDGIGPPTWSAVRRLSAGRPDLEVSLRTLDLVTMTAALDDGVVDAVLLHGPVGEHPGRRVVTVGEARVGVIVPRGHPLASRDALALDVVVPHLRSAPPRGASPEWVTFWLVRDHPAAPRLRGVDLTEDAPTMASTAARLGVLVLWPADVPVPEGSGAVLVPLVEERWAPLLVVHRLGLAPADALVAAACDAVRAAGRPGVVRPASPAR